MMQLYGAFVLFLSFSTACGLRCYSCLAADPKSCTNIEACSVVFNRCYSMKLAGLNMVNKGCMNSLPCIASEICCEGDLCNDAVSTGPGVVLLLMSSAFIMLFI